MELIFEFDRRQSAVNVRFDGLDGSEGAASVKEALGLLKIRNPMAPFADAIAAGAYRHVPDEEFQRMLETVKLLSSLWRYGDAPEEAPQQYEMNALMLLANAIEALSRLYTQRRQT